MADYQYKLTAHYDQDPTPTYQLTCGKYPEGSLEVWEDATSGVSVATGEIWYYWHDSNTNGPVWTDDNASMADIAVEQSWTGVINPNNFHLIVSPVNTTLTKLNRYGVTGNPGPNTPCRLISVLDRNNNVELTARDCQVGVPHGPIALDSPYQFPISFPISFDVPPNSESSSTAFWIKNQTEGGSSYDHIWAGVMFKNNYQVYKLHYNANGGSGAPASQTVGTTNDSNTFTVSSTKPTWSGHRFDGWAEDSSGGGTIYQGGDTITLSRGSGTSSEKTLYAVWTPDYRPGAALDTNTNIWKSHNRTNGACHVLSNTGNMTWQECRTVGGAEGYKGNPPLILTAPNANSWRDQKLLGKE